MLVKVTDLAAGQRVVVGMFDDDAAARTAVRRLQASGISEAAIGIARQSAAPPPSDTPAISKVFWTGFWWSIAGLAVGVAIGLILGLLGVGLPGTTDSVWLQVASWGMFVHVAGAIVGCYLALETGDRFSSNTAHHDQMATMVRVRFADDGEAARLEVLLKDAGASGTQRNPGRAPAAGP